jgi:hypothetical protein
MAMILWSVDQKYFRKKVVGVVGSGHVVLSRSEIR